MDLFFAFVTVFYYFYFLKQREASQENLKICSYNDPILISSSISHSLDTKPLPAIQYRSQTLRIRDSYLILRPNASTSIILGPINDSDTRHFQAYQRYLNLQQLLLLRRAFRSVLISFIPMCISTISLLSSSSIFSSLTFTFSASQPISSTSNFTLHFFSSSLHILLDGIFFFIIFF